MIAQWLLRVATRCLGDDRSEWARAMNAEHEHAVMDGRSIQFAFGCLIAALRDMPNRSEGRYNLVIHLLSIGLLIPVAALQLACAGGLINLPIGHAGLYAVLTPGTPQQAYLDEAYRAARPVLLTLWLLLSFAQWRLAWTMLDRDWPRVIDTAALILAASTTLVIFTGVLLLDPTAAILQAVISIIVAIAVYCAAYWHRRIPFFRSC